jgi:hypothetical protein
MIRLLNNVNTAVFMTTTPKPGSWLRSGSNSSLASDVIWESVVLVLFK